MCRDTRTNVATRHTHESSMPQNCKTFSATSCVALGAELVTAKTNTTITQHCASNPTTHQIVPTTKTSMFHTEKLQIIKSRRKNERQITAINHTFCNFDATEQMCVTTLFPKDVVANLNRRLGTNQTAHMAQPTHYATLQRTSKWQTHLKLHTER